MVHDQIAAPGHPGQAPAGGHATTFPATCSWTKTLWRRAYEDHPLPIGNGQTISQPYMVALMTDAMGLTGSEKVLEIGTGSGYQTAILAEAGRLGVSAWSACPS